MRYEAACCTDCTCLVCLSCCCVICRLVKLQAALTAKSQTAQKHPHRFSFSFLVSHALTTNDRAALSSLLPIARGLSLLVSCLFFLSLVSFLSFLPHCLVAIHPWNVHLAHLAFLAILALLSHAHAACQHAPTNERRQELSGRTGKSLCIFSLPRWLLASCFLLLGFSCSC